MSLSPDGKSLVGAESDGTLPIWDVASGRIVRRLEGHPAVMADRAGGSIRAVNVLLWSPDGQRLASLRAGDGGVRVWDVKTGQVLTSFQFGGKELPTPQNDAPPLAFSPDGRFLSVRSGWPGRKVRILDVTTGKQAREWDGGPDLGSSNAMAWDPAGKTLATCLGNPPRIQIWDVGTGQEVLALENVSFVQGLSFSPDGLRLASLALDRWRIHDLATRQSPAARRRRRAPRLEARRDPARALSQGAGRRGSRWLLRPGHRRDDPRRGGVRPT